MTPDQARAVLGVHADVSAETLRATYRRLLWTTHPDLAGEGATLHAARIIEAYEVLRATVGTRSMSREPDVQAETLSVRAIAPALFERFRAAADVVGDLTYEDPASGVLETLVTWQGWPPSSLTLTLEPKGRDTVVECTLESHERRPGPPIEAVVDVLRRVLGAEPGT